MTLFSRIGFIVWFLLNDLCMTHTIHCRTHQCQNTIIDCLPHQDCVVSCEGKEACLGSVVNCPFNGNCDIHCRGDQACQDTIIDATSSNGHFNLLCDESTDHCKGIKIYGSTLDRNTGNFTVTCSGHLRACVHSEIHCHRAGTCQISCDDDTSCRWAQITGPSMNGDLNIQCNGIKSCSDAILDGRLSSSLDIGGCTAYESCLDVTFYCPPNTNGHKNCFIQDNSGGATIYAIHGFDDLDVHYSGGVGSHHDAQMFCGDHYDISCDIATNTWSCADGYDDDEEEQDDVEQHCNSRNEDNVWTYAPTVSPSNIHTRSPSIAVVDTPPQQFTIAPTLNPTVVPTSIPSEPPSIHSTDSPMSNMSFESDSAQSEVLLWTWQLQIGFALFVMAMFLCLGIYCCKIRDRNACKSDTNQESVCVANQKQKTFPSKSEVDLIPMHDSNSDNVKCSTRRNVRNKEGMEDPQCFPDPSHVMYDAISIQTEKTMPRRSMSKESNVTNLSAMANASVNDIKEKNILFLNQLHRRYCMEVTIQRNGENRRRYDSGTCSSETEVSIRSNSSETSVDSSTEMFTDEERNLFYNNE